MPLILGANSVSGYTVKNSLRFNSGSSDNLSKTFASNSNRRTFTFSCWFKLCPSSATKIIFGGSDGTGYLWFLINSSGNIYLQNNPSSTISLFSTQLLRDPSAWYHIVLAVDTTQATSSNRVKIYLNGSLITDYTAPDNVYPSQNQDLNFTTSTQALKIGTVFTQEYFNGYMSEVYWIDGQQLTPSSFGETDEDTGIWKPKAFSGTYGTNGFYLQFKNSSSLGTDSSGNGNNFTVNNLTSVDQTTDTPTNNFCTMNPLNSTNSCLLTEGNLKQAQSANDQVSNGTIGFNKGKWYWEFKIVTGFGEGGIVLNINKTYYSSRASGDLYTNNTCIGRIFNATGSTNNMRIMGSLS